MPAFAMNINVGRQRPPVIRDTPPQLADGGGCVVCFVPADAGSDFCTPCRDRLKGTA